MRSLNLGHLQTFAVVVDLGSFSAAAHALNVTQPAISFQIRQLERRLGVRLIERAGRRAMASAAGAELLAHARQIDAAVTSAMDAMTARSTMVAGRVRIGAGATACIYLLPPTLRDLRQRFAGIELIVTTGNTDDVLAGVERNAIDIALVTLPVRGRSFEVTPVVREEFVVIASSREPPLPARVTPAALARLPLVHYESGGNTRRVIDQWFARGAIKAKPVMELGSVEAIKQIVGAGLGCAIVPRMATDMRDERVPLVVRPLTPRLHRTLAVVVRRDKLRQPAFREVLAALLRLSASPSVAAARSPR